MKKIIGGLFAILMLVIPFANTFAEGTTRAYKKGDVVNFKRFENDTDGVAAIVLQDSAAGDAYARIFSAVVENGDVPFANLSENVTIEGTDIKVPVETPSDYKNTSKYKQGLLTLMNSNGAIGGLVNVAKKSEDGSVVVDYPTKDELVSALDGNCGIDTCTFDVSQHTDAWDLLTTLANSETAPKKGFFTSTLDSSGTKVWALQIVADAEKKIQSASMILVDVESRDYAAAAIIDVDKTWDCLYQGGALYSCYNCNENYKWTEVGKQDASCQLVESIKTKSKCIKSPKTGVKEYAIEFIAILGIGIAILSVVKRKDLFRNI